MRSCILCTCHKLWLGYYINQYDELCLLSTTALTVDNILKELKQVKWEKLQHVLGLSDSQWHKINGKYAGETKRRREGVKYWLWNFPYASWRWLIMRLDEWEEHAVTDQIHGFAEKLTGMLGSSLYWEAIGLSVRRLLSVIRTKIAIS
jgi:hypothetical protein